MRTVRRRGVLNVSAGDSGGSRSCRSWAATVSPMAFVSAGSQLAGSSSVPTSSSSSLSTRSARGLARRLALSLLDVRLRDADGELPDAQDVRRPLGHADAVARIENVEEMRALERVLQRRPDQLRPEQRRRQLVVPLEQVAMKGAEFNAPEIDLAKHVFRLLDLVAQADVPVFHTRRPVEVVHAVDALQHHGDPLESVGELRRDRRELQSSGLLKVGELRNLHPVEHDLPADAPGGEGWRLPVVLFEANIVLPRVDAADFEALEVDLLHVVGRGLENDLKLVVF